MTFDGDGGPSQRRPTGVRVTKLVVAIAVAVTLAFGTATVVAFLAGRSLTFDIIASFRHMYLLPQAGAAALLLILKRPRWLLVALLLLGVNLAQVLPLYLPERGRPNDVGGDVIPLRVVSFNLLSTNAREEAVIEYLREEDPDVIVVSELTARWSQALGDALIDHEYRALRALESPFGIGVYSRFELTDVREIDYVDSSMPSIAGVLVLPRADVTLVATHPTAPLDRRLFDLRNEQLARMAATRADLGEDLLVVGDLNITSWSPGFDDVLRRMRLHDSRRGYGVQPTWPSGRRFVAAPIDHCLVSDRFVVTGRRVGPALGSDHRPIAVDLAYTV